MMAPRGDLQSGKRINSQGLWCFGFCLQKSDKEDPCHLEALAHRSTRTHVTYQVKQKGLHMHSKGFTL